MLTTVTLHLTWNTRIHWLIFGEGNFQRHDGTTSWSLKSYLIDGATDVEHDSAYALRLPLIGVTFNSLHYHTATFDAWVDPNNPEDFSVPLPDYNPLTMEGAEKCPDCSSEEEHIIVPDGFYVPPFDKALFEAVKGKRLTIDIGPVLPEQDDES